MPNTAPYTQNIVIDLEFTPTPEPSTRTGEPLENEVIEIGAVRVAPDGTSSDEFHTFVRPSIASGIAPHVRRLTGIRWADLADALTFAEALSDLSSWIGEGSTRMVAWSTSDEKQLEAECRAKAVALPSNMTRWLDLQAVFPRVMDIGLKGKPMSLHKAVEWCGLALDRKSEHTALLDAQHTAEMLSMLLTGEYLAHRQALKTPVASAPAAEDALGQMATALGPLYAKLMAGQSAQPSQPTPLAQPALHEQV